MSTGFKGNGNLDELTRDVARGGSTAFIGGVFGKVSILLLNIILGRFLGAANYGLYALGRSVVGIGQFIASLGLNQGVVRFCAIHRGEKNYARLKGTILSAMGIAFFAACLIGGLLFVFSETISVGFFHEPRLTGVLELFAFSVPFAVLTTIAASYAQSFQRIDVQQIILNIFRPLAHLTITVVVFLLSFRLVAAVWGFTASWILGTVTGLFYLLKIFPVKFFMVKGIYQVKSLLRFSIPTFFTGLSYLLLTYTDRLMLGYFGQAGDVGIYNAATTVSLQLPIFLSAFITIFMPLISELYTKKKTGELNSLFKTTTRWIFLLSLPLVMVVFLFAPSIMLLFGTPFVAGASVLFILGLAQLVNIGTGPVGMVLKMTGKQDVDFLNGIILVFLNIGLNYWFISKYGVKGAAIATCLSIALIHIVRLIEVYFLLKLFPYERRFYKPVLAGVISFSVTLVFKHLVGTSAWYFVIIAGILLVSVYFLVLWWLGIDDEDRMVLGLVKAKILKMRN